jgi:hypothetical protein
MLGDCRSSDPDRTVGGVSVRVTDTHAQPVQVGVVCMERSLEPARGGEMSEHKGELTDKTLDFGGKSYADL